MSDLAYDKEMDLEEAIELEKDLKEMVGYHEE